MNFILRTVTEGNREINQLIGNTYSFVDRDFDYTEFCDSFEKAFGRCHVADLDETANEHTKNVYGFVLWYGESIPLYKDHNYYIMTESGKTFSNLSRK